jgi:dienelactone hydrolase
MHWSHEVVSDGVRERRFELARGPGPVPGLLWTPTGAEGPRPLVLIGHGASGSKRDDYVVALARRLVRHHGYAAAAIDGPVHGERVPDAEQVPGLAFLRFSQRWAMDPAMTDEAVADWRGVIDQLQCEGDVGAGPVGFWGLSMGTILGLPLVAADRRVTAAVLGLMGLTGPTRERIVADAPQVRCPVLFLMQWEDELFPRETAFELFAALGSVDKRLHANVGRHGAVPVEELDASERFFHHALSASREG